MEPTIRKDFVNAIKARDEVAKRTLSLLVSAIDNERIALKRDLTEDEVLNIVTKECKKRHQAIEAYTLGQRVELAAKEEEELILLEKYLPVALTHSELMAMVRQIRLNEPGIHEGKLFGMMNKHSKGINKPEEIKKAIAEA